MIAEGTIRYLQIRAYNTAQAHGFTDATFGERIALIHSELSEALEVFRETPELHDSFVSRYVDGKPEGIPSELADVVIRVLDLCESVGIDLERAVIEKMDYNDGRAYRHGGKRL